MIPYDRYTELLGKRIHRTITPAEVADVAVFLCSPRSAYVAGATLDVSGGMLLH